MGKKFNFVSKEAEWIGKGHPAEAPGLEILKIWKKYSEG
jgi:hypothetical protein